MTVDMVQLVIQAGGIGVAIYALSVLRDFSKLISNHLEHEIKSQKGLTVALTELKDAIMKK